MAKRQWHLSKKSGRPLDEAFSYIHNKPIGQHQSDVYVLLDGEKVIIKIEDLALEKSKADAAIFIYHESPEARSPELKALVIKSWIRYVRDLQKQIFLSKQKYKKLKTLLAKNDPKNCVYVPKIYSEYSNRLFWSENL